MLVIIIANVWLLYYQWLIINAIMTGLYIFFVALHKYIICKYM